VRIILYLLTCFHFCFRKYSDFSLDTCNELDSPYTGPIKANKKPLLTSFSKSNRQSSRLSKKILSMENSDDDLIIPLKRVLRKKKVKTIVSSDSDETIIIDDDNEFDQIYFYYFILLAEIAEDDLDIETQQAIKEQTERDKRIKLQQEREELARLERIRKQKEYNGDVIVEHEKKHLPVAFELVLETDPNTNHIIIEVDLMLVQYMKQHQGKINSLMLILFLH
jgi:hypothetical protein